MIGKRTWMIFAAILSVVFTPACRNFGQVNQGRVIRYDRARGLITLIQDSNYKQPGNPRFDVLPPVTIKIPDDPKEMGPAPEAGKLLRLDTENRRVVVFDPATEGFKTVSYTLLEEDKGISRDDARVAGVKFPIVDRQKKTVTLYSARERKLVTFTVPEEKFDLPDDTWKAGDVVRYYYKQPDQALRLMNVTRTDITKGGK